MYARSNNGKIALDVLKAVCRAKQRNIIAARMWAAFAGYLA